MEATALLERIREAGAELAVRPDGQVVVTAPKGALSAELVVALRARRNEVLETQVRGWVAEWLELEERIWQMMLAFEAARDAGENGLAAGILAAQLELGNGPFAAATERLLSLPDELLDRAWREVRPETREGERPCWNCGATRRVVRADGGLVCPVCHPAVEPEMGSGGR